jgi:hypothetical protein
VSFQLSGQTGPFLAQLKFLQLKLKVSKFQKQILLFLFEPNNEQNYVLISALAFKRVQIKKNEGTLSYYLKGVE